jgi:osmoprotectant transport system substrate-binding protein
VSIGAPGPVPTQQRDDSVIVVASFDFPESELLAELYATRLASKGYPVRRLTNLGSREIVQPALLQDRVDLVPEYVGTALGFVTLGQTLVTSDSSEMRRELARSLRPHDVAVMALAHAQDQNGFVVTRSTAKRYGLKKVSDLRRVSDRLSFGGPPECTERPLCLGGLQTRYGVSFKRFVPLDAGGPTTVAAIVEGTVDVALLFTTDPNIALHHLVLLRDDKHLQPAENVVPVVRGHIVRQFGDALRDSINELSARLTTHRLRSLNRETQILDRAPHEVARQWLTEQGLIG